MAIQRPQLRYSAQDKRLIALLAQLVVDADANERIGGNIPRGAVILSEAECAELVVLLENLLSSGEFLEETYFIENLDKSHDPRTRRLFERARARRGRATLGWVRFQEFQRRFWTGSGGNLTSPPMEFDYFLLMEDRLLKEIGIHPRVRSLVLELLSRQRDRVAQVRAGKAVIAPGSIRTGFERIIEALKASTGAPPIKPERVAGAMTLIANLGTLFTSRDWSVAGTISTIGGAAILTTM